MGAGEKTVQLVFAVSFCTVSITAILGTGDVVFVDILQFKPEQSPPSYHGWFLLIFGLPFTLYCSRVIGE